jgi:type III restriction enzyme
MSLGGDEVILKPYQEKAVSDLLNSFSKLLEKSNRNSLLTFQAPTGSGKTVIMAKLIEKISLELKDHDFCFIWVSIGKGELHLQSHATVKYTLGAFPPSRLLEDYLTGNALEIPQNEVLFVNWEKLSSKDGNTNTWKNVAMRDGEQINFREILENTNENRSVILILDESHHTAQAMRAKELREIIDPLITIEMSATPKVLPSSADILDGVSGFVGVSSKEVIEEGMIKKEVLINSGLSKIEEDELDSQEIILDAAFRKREELEKAFDAEGSEISPLVLIQIPNDVQGAIKQQETLDFLSKKGFTLENSGVALILSDQPKSEELDFISSSRSPIKFLIFKQAIDTGWDCPRSHILVKLRQIRSETFEIQTVGRILRMPEQKHYENEILNKAYIYTNLKEVSVSQDEFGQNIIKHLRSERQIDYIPVGLTSFFKSRADYGDVTASFAPVFNKHFNAAFGLSDDEIDFEVNIFKLKKFGINLDVVNLSDVLFLNTSFRTLRIDEFSGEILPSHTLEARLSEQDLLTSFENAIKANMGSFKNMKRSLPTIKQVIYTWFRNYLGSKNWTSASSRIQAIFCNPNNYQILGKFLGEALAEYELERAKEVNQRILESESFYDFEIGQEYLFNQYTHERADHPKSIHQPCYLEIDRSKPERLFEKFLDSEKCVQWWWKNGVSLRDFFGIKYLDGNEKIRTFYPDYLVRFTDGRLGIFEVKSATDQDGLLMSTYKAEALYRYIVENRSADHPIVGGMIIPKGKQIKYHFKEKYDWHKVEAGDWSDWIDFPRSF